jgi:Rps23 Pro-64 3,4-dihydroxylase Tpa1-like proline 4-hydroxylase
MTAQARTVELSVRLVGGDLHRITLPEDARELLDLFAAMAALPAADRLLQLPLGGGKAACTVRASQVASVVSEPPVVLELQKPVAPATSAGSRLRRPQYAILDDFLGPGEYRELLALALAAEDDFKAGKVSDDRPGYRQNQVVMHFGDTVHSRLLQNRLLIWFPLLARTFCIPMFPLRQVESQLTAASNNQFYKVHCDDAPDIPRVISCVYYLFREPRGFAGGDLRLYDCIDDEGGSRRPAETFTTIEPLPNRMVVFPSLEFHEAMPARCPSGEFADSRFAITSWLQRATVANPDATFGWGHFRCGVVAPQFLDAGLAGSRAP